MQVIVKAEDAPLVKETINLRINGIEKSYRIVKKFRDDGFVIFHIPMEFPLEIVPLIFGPEARVLGGMEEIPHFRQPYRELLRSRRRRKIAGGVR